MDKYKSDHSKKPDQKKRARDISRLIDENHEIENKYIQAISELNLLKNRMKNLNHDLRGPLGGIAGMMDLMIVEEEMVEVQTSYLIMIRESAHSLLQLINGSQLVGSAHKSVNGSKSSDQTLSSTIMEINRLYLPMAQNKEISLSLKTLIDFEIKLSHDFHIALLQITGNLVANAVKFTPSKGSVYVVFSLSNEEDRTMFNVTVTDNGKGMKPGQVSAFNQGKPVARSIGTKGEESFGIGLQHVKKMVSDDNGHIVVKSTEGLGTIFSLSFPLSDKTLTDITTSFFTVRNGEIRFNGS